MRDEALMSLTHPARQKTAGRLIVKVKRIKKKQLKDPTTTDVEGAVLLSDDWILTHPAH